MRDFYDSGGIRARLGGGAVALRGGHERCFALGATRPGCRCLRVRITDRRSQDFVLALGALAGIRSCKLCGCGRSQRLRASKVLRCPRPGALGVPVAS